MNEPSSMDCHKYELIHHNIMNSEFKLAVNRNKHEVISKIAYNLWQQAEMPQGRDLEFWFKAQEIERQELRHKDSLVFKFETTMDFKFETAITIAKIEQEIKALKEKIAS